MKNSKKLVLTGLVSLLFAGSVVGINGSKGNSSKPELKEISKRLTRDGNDEQLSFSFLPELASGGTSLKVGGEPVEIIISESGGDPAAERNYVFESSKPSIISVDENGILTAHASGDVEIDIRETTSGAERMLFLTAYSQDPLSGLVSLSDSSLEERTEMLGQLEKYAMDNALTGLSLYENGGYIMYNPRIQKGTENYIPGYGFGNFREGNITEDLPSEPKAEWKRYYHSASSTDEKTINALNSKESSVSDLYALISSSYWDVKMNAEKDGYDWYGVLAKENRPIPGKYADGVFTPAANPRSSSRWWKFHVRTGSDGLTYRTLSNRFSSFDNRPVALEDYVYGYKLLLTQSFGLYRGSEHAGNEAKGYAFVGSQAYYNATKTSAGTDDEAFANNVHFYTGTDDQGAYLVVEMSGTYDPFFGMYYMSSNLYQPVCKDFILALGDGDEKLGVQRYGSFVESPSMSPVDTILSLGSRIVEYWEEDKTIAFKTNPTWFEKVANPNIWRVPGQVYNIYPGMKEDNTLAFKEFLDGKIDGAGIPTVEYLKQYRDDPRTTTTTGDTVFKLNMNTASQERWEELFGENGIVTQTPKSEYWDVKPWMSNKNFVKGLNASIDRLTYANNRGNIPSNNFFSSNYLSDPENGISYDSTQAHKNAMKDYYPETAGYNLEASKLFFRHAVEELVEEGKLEYGSKSNPTEISIEVWWMYEYMIEDDGAEIGKYIEDAFNDPDVCGGRIHLTVKHKAVTNWSDVYYNHLMVGQFDLGFGSVSGNAYDPLSFLDNLFQDGSSSFTLCWGDCDTSKCDESLIYDDRPWSFQGLFNAANTYAFLNNGDCAKLFDFVSLEDTRLGDLGLDLHLTFEETLSEDAIDCLYLIAVYVQKGDYYNEDYLFVEDPDVCEDLGNGEYIFHVPGEWLQELYQSVGSVDGTDLDRFGIDYYDYSYIEILDIEGVNYVNSEEFPLKAVPACTGISVLNPRTNLSQNGIFTLGEGQVIATFANGTQLNVTDMDEVEFVYDLSQQGPSSVTVNFRGQSATYDITVGEPATLAGIEVSDQSYTIDKGEEFVFDGKVTALFSDDTFLDVTESEDVTVSPVDTSSAGEKQVTVSYQGVSVSYNINVIEVSSIAVQNPVTELDLNGEFVFGGKVIATMSDGSTRDVTAGAEFSGYDLTQKGSQEVTVTFEGKTATYAIEVIDPTRVLESIAVSGQTLEFKVGDEFKFDGTVIATFSDASTKDVTSLVSVSEVDMSTAGTKEVTVSYGGKSVTYSIEVKKAKKGGCGGSVIASSVLLSSISASLLAFVALRRKKNED